MYEKTDMPARIFKKDNKMTELDIRVSALEDEFARMKRMYADMLGELSNKYTGATAKAD